MNHQHHQNDIGLEPPFTGTMIAEKLERIDGWDRCAIPT